MGELLVAFGLCCLLLGLTAWVLRVVGLVATWWRGRRQPQLQASHYSSSRRPTLPLDRAEANQRRWGRDLSGKRYESAAEFLADEHRGSR